MALVRVVTRCQIYCSCGRATTRVASHETALIMAARELSGCRRASPTYPILHQISEDLWLNVGVRLPLPDPVDVLQYLTAASDAPTPRAHGTGQDDQQESPDDVAGKKLENSPDGEDDSKDGQNDDGHGETIPR